MAARGRARLPGALLAALALGCGAEAPPSPAADAASPPAAATRGQEPLFLERAAAVGLDFVHFNGMSGDYYMAEVTGAGGALLDYDNDGDLDAYLVQGQLLGPGKRADPALTDRLYRNELVPGGRLRFTDVTAASGLAATGYGMGVATGDFDNDGWVDLYVTNFGPNQLLRNNGDGTFSDVTASSGTGDDRWSVAATFLDYDRDGLLDLFVGNYIDADLENRTLCHDFTGAQDYCGPGAFRPISDRLFHNRGGGRFADVTHEAGLRSGFGGALGAVAADLDGDGWPDLYVANDALPNNLWINQRDGTFVDDALLAGCSVNAEGKAEASMGLDAADFDNDGDLDLFMTHLTGETNTLYLNDGTGVFDDATIRTGLGPPSRSFTSFGTAAFDYDNDGWLDVLIVNGAVKKIEALARRGDPFPVHQPNQLFRNLGGGRFAEVTADAGEALAPSEVSRGALFGDVDNDGDTDVLIVNNNGPVRLLLNQIGNRNRWLGVRLLAGQPARTMTGALVELERRGGGGLSRRARTDGSFCSSNDPRVLFGLGAEGAADRLRVRWPDGSVEEWPAPPAGGYTDLVQGTGEAPGPAA